MNKQQLIVDNSAMTKKLAVFFLLAIMLIFVLACSPQSNQDYFFVEILAQSTTEEDVVTADKIAKGVYAYLAVLLNDSENFDDTESSINDNLNNIEYVVSGILDNLQATYDQTIAIKDVLRNSCQFGNTVIPKGKYKTLVITLGIGKGDTDFSVVYPSLTYVDGKKDIILKSKFLETLKGE